MKKKLLIFLVIIIIVVAIVSIFFKKDIGTITNIITGEEKLASAELDMLMIDVDDFNPIISKNQYVHNISNLVFESLINVNSELKPEAELAQNWSSEKENTIWIIELEQGVKFHNGNEFTADDVIFTINKIKEVGSGSIFYENIKSIDSMTANNKYKLTITLRNSDNFFINKLTFPIISKNYYSSGLFNKTPMGTGKYKYASGLNSGNIVLEYNKDYRKKKSGNIDKINLKVVGTEILPFERLKSGEIDIVDTKAEVGAMGRSVYESKKYTTSIFETLMFNVAVEGLNDKNVRQAILLGINRDSLIDAYDKGAAVTAELPINSESYLNNPNLQKYSYNPNQAKSILESAGWVNNGVVRNKKINENIVNLSFTLLVNKDDVNSYEKATMIANQLKSIGINLIVDAKGNREYQNAIETKNYQVAFSRFSIASYPEFLYYFGSKNLKNYWNFSNEEYDLLIANTLRITDEEQIRQNVYRMQEILNDEMIMAGMYFGMSTIYYDKSLTGTLNSNLEDIYSGLEEMKKI